MRPMVAGMRRLRAEKALQLNIQTDENDIPVSAEIFWQGMRILSMSVENFTFV